MTSKNRWFTLALLCASMHVASAESQRPMKIDDMFELEGVGRYYGGPYAFSPDGSAVAFTKVRPKKDLINHKWEYLWGNAGGDVWLQTAPGQEPTNLTNGISDGAGWWAPEWSPDGERIALLSTRAGKDGKNNVRLWLWEKSSGKLTQLTELGVDLAGQPHPRPYMWVDARHILCPVLPEGKRPDAMTAELRSSEIATEAWPKAAIGKEVTSNVLESGVPVDLSKRPQGQLWLIDVTDGSHVALVSNSTSNWQLAPGGKMVAFSRQTSVYLPKADELLPFGAGGTSTVELQRLDGRAFKTNKALPDDVIATSLRWSLDGKELAFLSYVGSRSESPHLYRVNTATGAVNELNLGALDATPAERFPRQIEWTAAGDLLVLGVLREGDKKPAVKARRDWWLVKRDGSRKALTSGMKSAPPLQLWPQEGQGAFFGIADGDVWSLRPDGKIENLTAAFEPKIEQMAWPVLTNSGSEEYPKAGATYSRIVLGVRDERVLNYFLFDLKGRQSSALSKPAPAAELVGYSPRSATALFSNSDKNGTYIWRSTVSDGKAQALMAANTFLKGIAEGEFKSIDYTSLQGEPLKAWIILPVGYDPGKRYPTITWVYAGSVAGPSPPSYETIAEVSALNKQVPAANGYAVLIPSMPLKPFGEADDPMMMLPNGVMPAVDEVVRQGIADPQRLYLMGQSFGGFSTYGLVTQTTRFKAAVSLAGLSNLISLYGIYDPRVRYTDYPQERLFSMSIMETGQTNLGNPPWKDLNRYIRNSPIFFVDRVQTPLMIIQGDMDYVSIQQGEEYFMSLYRQGKRAKFVRYWGEGHVLESPANIRDMWQQIFGWFGEFK